MASSTITRPGYVTDFQKELINEINNAPDSQYANLQYAGMNEDQKQALQTMMQGKDFNNYVDQLMGAGEAGTSALDNAYKSISNLYTSGKVTPESIESLTSQLYDRGAVQEGIEQANAASERRYSTRTAPANAQQTMQGVYDSGFGSSQALAKRMAEEDLTNEEQSNADTIAQNAYNAAQTQATAIFNANTANTKSALAGLTANAGALAQSYGDAGQLANNALQQGVAASQQQLQDEQNRLNVNYQNEIGAQNQYLQNLQNKLNMASAANGVLGMKSKTTTSGGGGGIFGGMVSGAISGTMAGGFPYGTLTGAAVGGASSAMSQ